MLVNDITYVHTGYTAVLSAKPIAIEQVRRIVARVLSGWGYDVDEVGYAQLVATELATNALQHGKCTDFEVRVFIHNCRARIEITDDNPAEPVSKSADDLEESGRGLAIVAALAEEWGTDPTRGGKCVYAVMPMPARESE